MIKTFLYAQTELHNIPRKHFRFEVLTPMNDGPLACVAAWFGRYVPTLRRNLPPSFPLLACIVYTMTLKMKAVRWSETSVNFKQTIRRHVPGDSILHNHRCENTRSTVSSQFHSWTPRLLSTAQTLNNLYVRDWRTRPLAWYAPSFLCSSLPPSKGYAPRWTRRAAHARSDNGFW